MSNLHKLSLVIPTFNDAPALAETLLSLSNLKFVDNLDIVIIDGGSTDNTSDVVHEFSNIVASFSSKPDEGEYDAMNIGIDASTTESILFLMAGDCIYSREGFIKMDELIAPCFVPVYRKKNNGRLQKLMPKSSRFFGLPHCHQGIIFKKPLPYFDLKYKISADFKHYLAAGYSDSLPLVCGPFYVVYDEGHSGQNYLVRDREIYEISKEQFGFSVGLVVFVWFKIKHVLKFFYR
jgi:glycosyltransferase involved in cell wall biosynthesis